MPLCVLVLKISKGGQSCVYLCNSKAKGVFLHVCMQVAVLISGLLSNGGSPPNERKHTRPVSPDVGETCRRTLPPSLPPSMTAQGGGMTESWKQQQHPRGQAPIHAERRRAYGRKMSRRKQSSSRTERSERQTAQGENAIIV